VAGVGRFEDLHVWRLSVEIRDAISRLTDSGKAARDFDSRDQIRGASSSAPRNIAEGFGRFRPKQFASFLRIARGSLHETRNLLHEARSKKYFGADEVDAPAPSSTRIQGGGSPDQIPRNIARRLRRHVPRSV